MKSTQTLPSAYIHYNNFRPNKWRKTNWVIYTLGIALAWLSYGFLRLLAEVIRPDFQPHPLHVQTPTPDRLWVILILVVILAIVFAIHELIHAIFLYFFTGRFPSLVAGAGGLAIRLHRWYIPRNQFLTANLAPFILITLVGILLLLPAVPQSYIGLTVFFTAMNIAGSIADIFSSAYLFLHSPSIYLETEGTIYFNENADPNLVPAWKVRVRSLFESAIDKLDPLNEAG